MIGRNREWGEKREGGGGVLGCGGPPMVICNEGAGSGQYAG